jgi:anti-sigma regulatory factor (Ser/Thr protein kinase)
MTSALPAPDGVGAASTNRVELSLAADPEMLFLARLTAAAVAARAEFDYEQIEDLRLAIDELCIRLMRHGAGTGRISLLFQWDDEGALDVTGALTGGDEPPGNSHHPRPTTAGPSDELSERILDALVDDHGEEAADATHRAWLRMSRQKHLA